MRSSPIDYLSLSRSSSVLEMSIQFIPQYQNSYPILPILLDYSQILIAPGDSEKTRKTHLPLAPNL